MKIPLTLLTMLVLSGCSPKSNVSVFKDWVTYPSGNHMDLRGHDFSSGQTMRLTSLGTTCVCDMTIQGNDSFGRIDLNSCAVEQGQVDQGCVTMNTTIRYSNQISTMEATFDSEWKMTYTANSY